MLFGKKKANLVGLDIGSRTLKAAEIIENKSGYTLKKFGMLDIDPGIIEDGNINDIPRAAESLRELYRLYNFREQNVAISIGGYSVISKNIVIQNMTEEQIQETIHFEAEQYIPFDISDVNLDFQVLGPNENNPNQLNVLLVAAKKDMVSDYIDLIEQAGLNICIIDVDAFALQNIYELNYDIVAEDSIALIDIGASKTSLNIMKGGNSVIMRDVSLGCGQINQKIAALADCSFEEAEQIKYEKNPEKITFHDLHEILSSVVGDWCTEIRRAFDFFYSTYPEDQIKNIILSGGGANIEQFRSRLAEETASDVSTINPFQKFNVDSEKFEASFLERIAPQAAICLGLATRKVDDK